MGFRFRKSISICPGVRLNIGKNGLSSVSVGARGASVSFGRQGTHANVGLPGTGLSYRTKLSPGPSKNSTATSQNKSIDPQLIQFVNAAESEMMDIINIHLTSPSPSCSKTIEQLKALYVQQKCLPFSLPEPARPPKPIAPPKPEMDTSWLPSFFQSEKSKAEKEQDHRIAVERWERQNQIEQENYVKMRSVWATDYAIWKKSKDSHEQNVSNGKSVHENNFNSDVAFFEQLLSDTLYLTNWPRETNVSFQVNIQKSLIELDVDLPEVEDIPTIEYRLNKRGTEVLEKNKTDKKIRMEYARFVHGILFKLVAISFSSLPFNTVKISGFTQRVDRATGRINDDYIISTEVLRSEFERINFNGLDMIDPVMSFDNFALARNMTATGIFKVVEPI